MQDTGPSCLVDLSGETVWKAVSSIYLNKVLEMSSFVVADSTADQTIVQVLLSCKSHACICRCYTGERRTTCMAFLLSLALA